MKRGSRFYLHCWLDFRTTVKDFYGIQPEADGDIWASVNLNEMEM